ncbi:MAG: pyocin activator PrtN family protein [Moraxella sp.]|nr:pyocin activator PrtN family protein [Moraxella sp.]
MTAKISIQDYLFLQFGKLVVELREVCQTYYPHLNLSQINKKVSVQGFPFPCFLLAESQKSPYFVHIGEQANDMLL